MFALIRQMPLPHRALRFNLLLAAGQVLLFQAGYGQEAGRVHTRYEVSISAEIEQSKDVLVKDSINLRYSETCTYSVLDWSTEAINLERLECKPELSVAGQGSLTFVDPFTNAKRTRNWVHTPNPPEEGGSRVELDPSSGAGTMSFDGNLTAMVNTREAGAEETGGNASLAMTLAQTMLGAATSGIVPPGVQFSSSKPYSEFIRFQFDPKSKKIRAGNQLQSSISFADGEGGATKGTTSMSYTVTLGANEDPGEMVFEMQPSYAGWLPAPLPAKAPGVKFRKAGSLLPVKVRILPRRQGASPRKARIQFTLSDVTKHKGLCGNYPRAGNDEIDLKFADEQPSGIKITGTNTAATVEEVSEAEILIEATDTGAYGKLAASAPTLGLKAIYKATGKDILPIPRDDDGDKLGDAWEEEMGIPSQRDLKADSDQRPKQKRAGDGLTVFDEYRGLVVLENGAPAFKRFNPKVKEIFVRDPGDSLDREAWEKASDIDLYKVDESMLAGGSHPEESRVINFNSADTNHKKYAVWVQTMPGDADPDDPNKENPATGQTPCDACRSPKDADYCRIFPYRIRLKFEEMLNWLTNAVTKPGSQESQELAGFGFPPWLPQRALENLRNPEVREKMVRQRITHVTIHEVGHAAGLGPNQDHTKGVPQGTPGRAAEIIRECPMYYPADKTDQRWIVLQSIFRSTERMSMVYKQFCGGLESMESDGFNCYSRMNVADW